MRQVHSPAPPEGQSLESVNTRLVYDRVTPVEALALSVRGNGMEQVDWTSDWAMADHVPILRTGPV